jgi:hypothetical protein
VLVQTIRQRNVLVHCHIEAWGKALAIGAGQVHLIDAGSLDRAYQQGGLVVERMPLTMTDAQIIDLSNALAGAPIWLRVTKADLLLRWVTRGWLGNDCVSVTCHILRTCGIEVPRRVRRVKELREWLTGT